METTPSAGANQTLKLPVLWCFNTDTPSLSALQQNEAKEEEEGGTKDLSEEEVQTRIEKYNAQVSENGMKLVSFTHFMKLVNVL